MVSDQQASAGPIELDTVSSRSSENFISCNNDCAIEWSSHVVTITQASLKQVKILLSIAADGPLAYCHKIFCEIFETSFMQGSTKLGTQIPGIVEKEMNNLGHEHTIRSKEPSSGYYYIFQTALAFNDFVCDSLESVHYGFF